MLRARIPFLPLSLACALAACAQEQPTPPDPAAAAGFTRAPSRDGRYVIEWRSVPAPLPVNEDFELEIKLTDATTRAPIEEGEVYVHATMPGHGHGMVREPRFEEIGGGHYRVRGMLFHMHGLWELEIEAIAEDVADVARVELDL